MNSDLISGLDYFEREKGIKREVLVEAVQNALLSASKKAIGPARELRIEVDGKTGEIRAIANMLVVETVQNTHDEISLSKARAIKPDAAIGDAVEVEVTPRNFGRIAAQTAKQAMMQRIRQAEKEMVGRARELQPLLRQHASYGDEHGVLHPDVFAALTDAGFWAMAAPRRWGGLAAGHGRPIHGVGNRSAARPRS